jgi:hypothetical protein
MKGCGGQKPFHRRITNGNKLNNSHKKQKKVKDLDTFCSDKEELRQVLNEFNVLTICDLKLKNRYLNVIREKTEEWCFERLNKLKKEKENLGEDGNLVLYQKNNGIVMKYK